MAEAMTPADMSAVLGNRWGYPYGSDGFGFGGGSGGSLFAILLIILLMGGGNAWGAGRGAFGTEAIQNQMQQGFDNQNTMANQREILGAINQTFHDNLNVIQDKYGELTPSQMSFAGDLMKDIAKMDKALSAACYYDKESGVGKTY